MGGRGSGDDATRTDAATSSFRRPTSDAHIRIGRCTHIRHPSPESFSPSKEALLGTIVHFQGVGRHQQGYGRTCHCEPVHSKGNCIMPPLRRHSP